MENMIWILLMAVSMTLAQKFLAYGRLGRVTARWDPDFNQSTAVPSGSAIYKGKQVTTYICRLWRDGGDGYVRVGRYIPEAKCCALSFSAGKTECSRVQIEHMRRVNLGKLEWMPAQGGKFDLKRHNALVIGGTKDWMDQYICRFPYNNNGADILVQGRLNPGDDSCSGMINIEAGNQEMSSDRYDLLRIDIARIYEMEKTLLEAMAALSNPNLKPQQEANLLTEAAAEYRELTESRVFVPEDSNAIAASVANIAPTVVVPDAAGNPLGLPITQDSPTAIQIPPAVQNPPAVQKPQAVLNPAAIQNPTAFQISSAVQHPPAIQNPAAAQNPPVIQNNPAIQNPSAVKTPAVAQSSPAAQIPSPAQNPPAAQNPIAAQNPSAAQNPPAAQNLTAAQYPPAIRNPSAVQNNPEIQDPGAVQNPPAIQNPLAVQNNPAIQDPAAVQNLPAVQNPSAVQNPPGVQNPPAAQNPPANPISWFVANSLKGNPDTVPVAPDSAKVVQDSSKMLVVENNVGNLAASSLAQVPTSSPSPQNPAVVLAADPTVAPSDRSNPKYNSTYIPAKMNPQVVPLEIEHPLNPTLQNRAIADQKPQGSNFSNATLVQTANTVRPAGDPDNPDMNPGSRSFLDLSSFFRNSLFNRHESNFPPNDQTFPTGSYTRTYSSPPRYSSSRQVTYGSGNNGYNPQKVRTQHTSFSYSGSTSGNRNHWYPQQ